jgi:isoleucyl-tRNA synthetase
LSNWYLRHNRRRFRADGEAARSAFETLGRCLGDVVRLVAPILPFTAEKLYQNLERGAVAGAPVSVHLTRFPAADAAARDPELADAMRAVVRFTSLALAARKAAGFALRQPLQTLEIGVASEAERAALARFSAMLGEELNVKSLVLLPPGAPSPLGWVVKPDFKALGPKVGDRMGEVVKAVGVHQAALVAELRKGDTAALPGFDEPFRRADFLVQVVQPEGRSAAEDRGAWCAVSTTLTRELEIEGLMRDLLRRLMAMRKEQGLEISDRVTLRWDSDHADVVELFEVWGGAVANDLQADALGREPGLDAPVVDLAGRSVRVRMAPA